MMKIRTKILLYSMVFVLLLNGVAFFLYQNSQKSIVQYNNILKTFFLLNTISQKTNGMYQSLNAYVTDRSPDLYRQYKKEREALVEGKSRLQAEISFRGESMTLENYANLISSLLEECTVVMNAYNDQNLNVYSEHLTEASKIARYIQEVTLSLINQELTDYQYFYHDMNMKNNYFRSLGISIFSSTILFSTLLAIWFSKGITRPISRLSRAAEEIASGNFEGKDVSTSTKDELSFLAETFNSMRKNIRRLIQEIKEKSELDKLLKEMELKSLQSQINPHFLFNTLNTVSKMAYIEGAKRTNELIDSVSHLLRYNLKSLDQPTTLKEEVAVVQEYFFIQQTRFGERVKFQMEVGEECLSVAVPGLTLQPIVENAFIHGVESYEHGACLALKIFKTGLEVVVEVIDNGIGMDEKTVKTILRSDEKESGIKRNNGHSTGLGMRNVIKRLELFYQQKNMVEIESIIKKGTTIRLRLPLDRQIRG
ncbi:sensor histidine kinase [Fictibacillus gelatini]|uniref:sensor histidine kinase n=1 Tax=Fictibacillus gelatini TaxID=225985 RepID=UPI00042892B9|nr:sensor histidine kinase [Fictibacillus gelatini]